MRKTLVIGATGRVGRAVVTELQRRGHPVRAAVHRTGTAFLPGLVTGVEFDFERPETFEPALDGMDQVFLIARPGDDEADRIAAPLLHALLRKGIGRVVNLTAMGVEAMPDTALRRIERAIEDAGIAFTHLRPNFFMQIFADDPIAAALRVRGVIAVPAGDARLSFVDTRDIAAVAAVALTESGHEGRAYTLTGDRALDHHEVAEIIARASGRAVTYAPLDEATARQSILDAGLSPARAERLIGFYRSVRAGHCRPVSFDIEDVLGRPPIAFDQFARDYAKAWTQDRSAPTPSSLL